MYLSLRVAGIGGPWVHCGCALALQAYYKPLPPTDRHDENAHDEEEARQEKGGNDDDDDDETFAAVAMGCGSNAPLRAREGPLPPAPAPDAHPAVAGLLPPPQALPLPQLPLPPLPPQPQPKASEQRGIQRHLHTRYVRAVDEACQGPLDSPRCLFDHEVA